MAATRHNVVGAFADERAAHLAVKELGRAGVDSDQLRLVRQGEDDDPARVAVLRAEMRDEHEAAGSRRPIDGVFWGTLVGGIVGLVAGVVSALWGHGPLDPGARSLLVLFPFAAAGAVVGAVRRGVLQRRTALLASERDTLVAVGVRDARAAERARHMLEDLGAERVDEIDRHGAPLEPQR